MLNQVQVLVVAELRWVSQVENGTGNMSILVAMLLMEYKKLLRILVLILEEMMLMDSHGLLEETFIEMDPHQLMLVRHFQ